MAHLYKPNPIYQLLQMLCSLLPSLNTLPFTIPFSSLVPESCSRQGKSEEGLEGLSLDADHVWLIYYMCVKALCLSHSRGLGHKGWWVELRGFSITPSSEAPQHSDPEINPALPINASSVQSLPTTAQPINRPCSFARSHFSQISFA